MRRYRVVRSSELLALFLALSILGTACSAEEVPTFTIAVLQEEPTRQPAPETPTSIPPKPSPVATQPPPPLDTATPEPEPATATASPQSPSWHAPEAVALIVSGDDQLADFYALSRDGATSVLLSDVGSTVSVSSDGRWLGFFRWGQDGRGVLELHDAASGESRQITPDTSGGLFRFAFAPDRPRLAYLDLGAFTDTGVPWALVIVDLENGETVRYEGQMVDNETRPLPGAPVGWSGASETAEEIIIDTFLPYTEGGSMGVWGVSLPDDSASVSLDSLRKRELIPSSPVYASRLHLAPDRQRVAFLGRDPDYFPDNYFPEFYDLAVNRLEVASLEDGARTLLVEASDGSALARGLAWSPSGERILFTQGHYEGEEFAELSLKSTDLSGTVVTYGPLTLPPLGGLLDLAWCDSALALYLAWDGSNGTQHLLIFDLNTGVSTEIAAAQRLEIVGCVP